MNMSIERGHSWRGKVRNLNISISYWKARSKWCVDLRTFMIKQPGSSISHSTNYNASSIPHKLVRKVWVYRWVWWEGRHWYVKMPVSSISTWVIQSSLIPLSFWFTGFQLWKPWMPGRKSARMRSKWRFSKNTTGSTNDSWRLSHLSRTRSIKSVLCKLSLTPSLPRMQGFLKPQKKLTGIQPITTRKLHSRLKMLWKASSYRSLIKMTEFIWPRRIGGSINTHSLSLGI